MIAYKRASLEAMQILQTAGDWAKRKLISEESHRSISETYKHDLYMPKFLVRVGLFIFTTLLVNACIGLITLMSFSGLSDEGAIGGRLIVYGFLIFAVLELYIRNKKPYRAGIDDALLYNALLYLLIGISMAFFNADGVSANEAILWVYCSASLLLLFCALRYVDMLVTAAAYTSILCVIGQSVIMIHSDTLLSLLPFIVMIFSAGVYLLKKKSEGAELLQVWKDNMDILEICALVSFYLGGNYFAVRQLSEKLMNVAIEEGSDIPFAPFFYTLTAVIPLVYLVAGLRKKDRILTRTGLVIFALGILTFKYYFSLGHTEITLTVAGLAMTGAALFIMRYLKQPRHGLSVEPDESDSEGNVEAVVIAETLGKQETLSPDPGIEFGGGKFGGGGAQAGF